MEKALFESLKELEAQCKERIDILEALKKSRQEAQREERADPMGRPFNKGKSAENLPSDIPSGWLGGGTIPPAQHSDLPRPSFTPSRPSFFPNRSSELSKERSASVPSLHSSPLGAPPSLPIPLNKVSRSPSPDHGKKTMKTTLRSGGKSRPSRSAADLQKRPAPMKAAGLAWDITPRNSSGVVIPTRESDPTIEARLSATAARRSVDLDSVRQNSSRRDDIVRMPDPNDYMIPGNSRPPSQVVFGSSFANLSMDSRHTPGVDADRVELETLDPPPPTTPYTSHQPKPRTNPPLNRPKPPDLTYRKEYPTPRSSVPPSMANKILDNAYANRAASDSKVPARKPVPSLNPVRPSRNRNNTNSESETEPGPSSRPKASRKESTQEATPPSSNDADSVPSEEENNTPEAQWNKRKSSILSNLPRGVDAAVAKNILNEIVVQGDEVHWSDVAGLELAKKALKEAVVYPFLRPDLFMGLREPARGMLLFGPPGTGKTMLARAVATESKSTFFAISASSLTSKWHGESEKLVRALFALAKALAPSIIFVDEIDSLLSARSGSSEHEASRRSKTEFLIQWSDLQRAAAGRDTSIGDATRVLVLAATNCPWDIDEAARRRFVRRQYIPLPEMETRETQIRTLLGAQKHNLDAKDIWRLVTLTEGKQVSQHDSFSQSVTTPPFPPLLVCPVYPAHQHTIPPPHNPFSFLQFTHSFPTFSPTHHTTTLTQTHKQATQAPT